MSLIRCLVFIALSFVPYCCPSDQFRCKAVPGCEIARCDPTPFSWGHLQKNEFSISCVSDDEGKEKVNNDEVKKLKVEMENQASDLKRLWDMNELQNNNIRTMREQLDQSAKEISELREKNANLENSATSTQETVDKLQEKNKILENELKIMKMKDNVMSEDILKIQEKNRNLEHNGENILKTVIKLQEKNKEIEKDLVELKKEQKDIPATFTPSASTTAFISLSVNSIKKPESTTEALAPTTTLPTMNSSTAENKPNIQGLPTSCQDVNITDAKRKTKTGGVFDIYVKEMGKEIEVSCDLKTDDRKWTVFQRRMDGNEDFYRGWDDYVNGFGRKNREFWLGLENIHQMTKNGKFELRVDLKSYKGKTAFAKYRSFSIGSSAENYRLHVGAHSGTARNGLGSNNGHQFSTKDNDNDGQKVMKCAEDWKGAWWYTPNFCGTSNLNGLYGDTVTDESRVMFWLSFRSNYEPLKFTEMKFRLV